MTQSTKNRLTITLLTYNRANYLKLAIEAILRQTYKEYDLCIYDNGSTDNTREVVASFNDARVKYVHYEVNNREVANKSIMSCNSDYLIITHDDDLMKPDMLRRQINILDGNQNVIMVSTNMDYIDSNNTVIKQNVAQISRDVVYHKHEYIKAFCENRGFIFCPTVMFRMAYLKKRKLLFNNDVGPVADIYMWFEINNDNKMLYVVKDPLYLYRLHPGQDSEVNCVNIHINFFQYAKQYLISNNLDEYVLILKRMLYKKLVHRLLSSIIRGRESRLTSGLILEELKTNDLWVEEGGRLKLKIFICSMLSPITICLRWIRDNLKCLLKLAKQQDDSVRKIFEL